MMVVIKLVYTIAHISETLINTYPTLTMMYCKHTPTYTHLISLLPTQVSSVKRFLLLCFVFFKLISYCHSAETRCGYT